MCSSRKLTDATTTTTYENGTFQTNKMAKNIGLCLHSIPECKCRFLSCNLLVYIYIYLCITIVYVQAVRADYFKFLQCFNLEIFNEEVL